ncbi:MAG: HD domain-containing protein [Deferrisomatales bacterium]|nr:HD domain-containing protein [Deferrisomatales bacterium]
MKRDVLDQFLRDLASLITVLRIYPAGNEQVVRAADKAAATLAGFGRPVRIARVGQAVVVEDRTLEEPATALVALLDRLAARGREALQIDAAVRGSELAGWLAAALRGEVPGAGGLIRAGSFELEDEAETPASEAETAAGYLSLLPGVRETLSELADERQEGLSRAREIVRVIAGQVATGEKLFDPIRDLKAHDDYTFTHALNVCVLTTGMCRVLGMAEALVDTVSLAALCHDIGKEKVPTAILNKQGPLDAGETEIMNRHPAEGAAVLLRLPEKVHPLLPIVAFQHHRHADGSGYPSRPTHPGPHPASLLVAVADVFDALCTVRPYQDPRSTESAFSVMLRRAHEGRIDPLYLGAFTRLLGLLTPGDRVRLGDGRAAWVVEAGPHPPLRPVVRLENGTTLLLAREPELWLDGMEDRAA